jgi:hypothetical protein
MQPRLDIERSARFYNAIKLRFRARFTFYANGNIRDKTGIPVYPISLFLSPVSIYLYLRFCYSSLEAFRGKPGLPECNN